MRVILWTHDVVTIYVKLLLYAHARKNLFLYCLKLDKRDCRKISNNIFIIINMKEHFTNANSKLCLTEWHSCEKNVMNNKIALIY